MRFKLALLFSLLFVMSGQIVAQELSKEERKKWKTVANNYKKDPAAMKALVEERDMFQRQAQDAQARINSLQSSQDQAMSRANQLEQEVARMNNDLMTTQETIRQLTMENERLKAGMSRPSTPSSPAAAAGVVFRVQVGAFSRGRIPQRIQNMPDMMVEDSGNVQKVMVGAYRSIDDARARASQMKRDGMAGAFVVAYKNGSRISIEEALRN